MNSWLLLHAAAGLPLAGRKRRRYIFCFYVLAGVARVVVIGVAAIFPPSPRSSPITAGGQASTLHFLFPPLALNSRLANSRV